MITVLVVEDEKRIYELLSQVLRQAGYTFVDEPESGGLIKIIKKSDVSNTASVSRRFLALENNLLREKDGVLYKSILAEVERPLIEAVLEKTEGNQLRAARILGINRNTLKAKIRKLGIDIQRWKWH
jgi:DNA-binding protein Fis